MIGVILERLNAARDRILAQEASNKELVQGLSSQRAQLKGYLQQLYAADQQVEAWARCLASAYRANRAVPDIRY